MTIDINGNNAKIQTGENPVRTPSVPTPPAPAPVADFSWSSNLTDICPYIQVGSETVTMINNSTDADSYAWVTSWGDTSADENPVFNCPYNDPAWIQLTASKGSVDDVKKIDVKWTVTS